MRPIYFVWIAQKMTHPAPKLDPKDFRNALSMFATGVTIVTARGEDGEAVGTTVNSFNSVSLDPPLVLWSLAKNARSLPVYEQAEFWNVHILANDQEALSNKFARMGEDKFAGIALDAGVSNAPLLPGCSARFQCKTAFQYEGGDHIILVGEVIAYDRSPTPPLLYLSGSYALATKKSGTISTEAVASDPDVGANSPALFSEDLLGYLLGRADYQFMSAVRPEMEARQLSEKDFFALSLLSVREQLPPEEIAEHTAYTGASVDEAVLDSLVARNYVHKNLGVYGMTKQGRDAMLHVIAAAKAQEADLGEKIGELEITALRNLLKRTIAQTDPGLSKLWKA